MPIRAGAALVSAIYAGAAPVSAVYAGGVQIYAAGGVPAISALSATPDKLASGSARATIEIRFAVARSTRNVLYRRAAGAPGWTAVPLTTSTTAVIATPAATTEFRLVASNANGASERRTTFTRGTAPAIAQWTWDSFRQGIGGLTSDTVLLHWRASGDPAPSLRYDPGGHALRAPSGSRVHVRPGAAAAETLTLTAENVFGRATAATTIRWPRGA